MSRSRSVVLGALSSQVFMLVTMLVNIATVPVVLRFLDKKYYGLWIALTQMVSYLVFIDLGLYAGIGRFLAMNRESSDPSALSRAVSTGFFVSLALGALVIAVALAAAPQVPALLGLGGEDAALARSLFTVLGVWSGLQFPMRAVSGLFFAHQRQLFSHLLTFVFAVAAPVMNVCFLYLGYGLWSLAVSYLVVAALNVVTLCYLVRRHYPDLRIGWAYFDLPLLRGMYGYCLFLFLNGLAWLVVSSTDRVLIGSLVSLSAVTTFSLTARVPDIAMHLVFKMTDNTYPVVVEVDAQKRVSKLREIHQKLMVTTVSLACVAFWIILALDETFIRLWVGPGFFAGDDVLLLVCLLMLYHSHHHVTAVCLDGVGQVRGASLFAVAEAALNLGLSVYLGRRYGVVGIVGATLVSAVLTSAWYKPRVAMRYMKMPLREYLVEPILRPLLSVSAAGVVLYTLSRMVLDPDSAGWASFAAFGLSASALLAVFTWFVVLKKELETYVPTRFRRFLGVALETGCR